MEDLESLQRQGLRVGRRLRGREDARVLEGRRSSGSYTPFDNSFSPGERSLRLLHRAGLVHARTREGRRLLERRTTSSTRPWSRTCRHADREGEVHRRASSRTSSALRSGRRATTTSSRTSSPTQKPHVYDNDRRRAGAQERARSTASSSTSRRRSTSPPFRSRTASSSASSRRRGAQEHFGIVLAEGEHPDARCVNSALNRLCGRTGRSSGSSRRRLAKASGAPVLK